MSYYLGAAEVSLGPVPDWNEIDRQNMEKFVQQIGYKAAAPSSFDTAPADVEGVKGSLLPSSQTYYTPLATQAKSANVAPSATPSAWQWPAWSLNVTQTQKKAFPWLLLLLAGGAVYLYARKQPQARFANPESVSAKTWRERLTTIALLFGAGMIKGTGEIAARKAAPITEPQIQKLVEQYKGVPQSGATVV